MVTKNTLAKLAIKGTPFEVLADSLKGPIAIAFGFGDQVAPAKALSKFIESNSTIGAIASKKCRCSALVNFCILSAILSLVNGPDAIITFPSGISVNSSLISSILGLD